jgi:DNA helicase-2/ATP-dependent DNA helicase PcrA
MYIGTIHSYCQMLLGAMDARYRQFEVLDENRLKLYLLYNFYSDEIGLHVLTEEKRKGQKRVGQFEAIDQLASAWMIMNDEMLTPEMVATHDETLGEVLAGLSDKLNKDEFIDFSLMQRLVVDALRKSDAGILEATRTLRHLLVDEYQDINPVQEELIQHLHKNSDTLFVVGDDDQSIYGWRGADVTRILTFEKRYVNCSVHTLNMNYRSTPRIVRVADKLAAAELGATRLEKNPEAQGKIGPEEFRVLWFPSRETEAEWVAASIEKLIGTKYVETDGSVRGLTPADFAILMRSTRQPEQDGRPRHAAFSEALSRRSIKFSIEAGGGLFDRPEVQALRATFELFREGQPGRRAATSHFEQVIIPCFPKASFEEFARVVTVWGRDIHTPTGDGARRRIYPQKLVHDLLEAFRISETSFDDAVMRDIGVFSQIIQDVESVYMSVDTTSRFKTILNFLQNVAETGYDSATAELLQRPDAVTISTIHKMKGLEFPVVFLVDVEAQRFPKKKGTYDGWLPSKLLAASIARGAYCSTREEEARLFYTALTRAERLLFVSGAEALPAAKKARKASPFVAHLTDPAISRDSEAPILGLTSAPPKRRHEDSDLPTSYSEIRYFARCPKDYQFRKLFGFSPPIVDLFGFGMTVHAAIGKLHERFKNGAPSLEEADAIARKNFHLKHVPKSNNPKSKPGPYERARDRAAELVSQYAVNYSSDFARRRQVEARFEIPIEGAVISGAIDLMLHEDSTGRVLEAEVIDFKTLGGGQDPVASQKLEWTELALQVQLYAKAGREVLGQAIQSGYVHLLKDDQRIPVPIHDAAVNSAIENVRWSVKRILDNDFPMRPQEKKCSECDFGQLCSRRREEFKAPDVPPPIFIPGEEASKMIPAFSCVD